MKLTQSQVEAHLSTQLAPIYILSGDEILLKQDILRTIRQAALKKNITEKLRFTPASSEEFESLHAELNTNSFFSNERLIEIDCRTVKLTKQATEILENYARSPKTGTTLILDFGKIEAKTAKSSWFKALDAAGIHIPCWPISRGELPAWLMTRAKKYKLTLSLPALNTLADLVEGNLIAAAQALEKLYLLKSDTPIDAETIHAIFEHEGQYSIYELCDALLAKNKKRTVELLSRLHNEGIEPILILWAITREIRTLAAISEAHARGENIETHWQKHNIFSKKQPLMRRFVQTTPHAVYRDFLKHARSVDEAIKGAGVVSSKEALLLLCMRIATC